MPVDVFCQNQPMPDGGFDALVIILSPQVFEEYVKEVEGVDAVGQLMVITLVTGACPYQLKLIVLVPAFVHVMEA